MASPWSAAARRTLPTPTRLDLTRARAEFTACLGRLEARDLAPAQRAVLRPRRRPAARARHAPPARRHVRVHHLGEEREQAIHLMGRAVSSPALESTLQRGPVFCADHRTPPRAPGSPQRPRCARRPPAWPADPGDLTGGGRPRALVRPGPGQATRPDDRPALPGVQDRADVPPGPSLGTVPGQAARRRAVPAPGADHRGAVGPRRARGAGHPGREQPGAPQREVRSCSAAA